MRPLEGQVRVHPQGSTSGSYPTRLAATVRTFAKARPGATLEEILDFAERLDVWEELEERVQVMVLPKAKGGYRLITKHGPKRMAQQFIVRDLLTLVGVDNEFDFARRGAGGEKAQIREVCQRIEVGYRHWQTVDIKECFASLRPGHFGWLPVPEPLLRSAVFLPKCAKVGIVAKTEGLKLLSVTSTSDTPLGSPSTVTAAIQPAIEKVRRGLPQGSVLSPLVARAFVGRELRRALPGDDEVARFSFVDNLILGARYQPKLNQALDKLRTRLLALPAGPISLHIDPPTWATPKRGMVRAMGYRLLPGRGYGDNCIHVIPDLERFDRGHRKLYDRWDAAGRPDDYQAKEDFVLDWLAHWMPSQQAWTTVPVLSRNIALTHAFMDLCERDIDEFRQAAALAA